MDYKAVVGIYVGCIGGSRDCYNPILRQRHRRAISIEHAPYALGTRFFYFIVRWGSNERHILVLVNFYLSSCQRS